MGNKAAFPRDAIFPVTKNWMPEVWGSEVDPETLSPIKKQTGFWGEFTMEWDDATKRELSGFYMRWTVGGEGWTWPSGTWVQNYAQFENPIKPGNYRAVTCSALYNQKEGAALNYVMGYQGRRPFTDEFVGRNVSWNDINALDLDRYSTWEADPFKNRQPTSYYTEYSNEPSPDPIEFPELAEIFSYQTCTAAIIFDWNEKGEDYFDYKDEFIMSIKTGVEWQVQTGWRTWQPNTNKIVEAYDSVPFPVKLSALTVEPADHDISGMLQFGNGDQMGSYAEDEKLPIDHSVSRNIKSWSSEITSTGANAKQGGGGDVNAAWVEQLPTTFTSVPETGSIKQRDSWNLKNGINQFPRTFHSQDMTGMMKTSKTLNGKAYDEVYPLIVEHDKKVRNWTFWISLFFCCGYCCAVGVFGALCIFGFKFGPIFDAWWETTGKKRTPGGKTMDLIAEGEYSDAYENAKQDAGINESSSSDLF